MGKHAQLVIGPAGSGKSTYCQTIQQHCYANKRAAHVINLDPAAENFNYDVSLDIRDLISLDDVVEELKYGPNGGLIFCMEYLVQNLDWLEDKINDYGDDYLILDCPGQIELYTHLPVMTALVKCFQRLNYRMCAVNLVDSLMVSDASKFVSGSLMCLSTMVLLELPHINVLSKCDLIEDPQALEKITDSEIVSLVQQLNETSHGKFQRLNESIGYLLDEYNMVSFVMLDSTKQDSIELVLSHVDNAMQYGEDVEVKPPKALEDVEEEPDPDLMASLANVE